MFVTFEGPEGAGKSTALRSICELLTLKGHQVVTTREPGAGAFGQKIRKILLEEEEVVPEAELLLFLADRANHVQTLIAPALLRGHIVLCDRYADSTIVYQGMTRGLEIDFLNRAIQFATKGLTPDLTILFDLPAEVGLSRLNLTEKTLLGDEVKRRDTNRIDREPLEFHQKIRAGFLQLAEENPDRFVVLDATMTPEEVVSQAMEAILCRNKSLA
jgi:dTMP kinase